MSMLLSTVWSFIKSHWQVLTIGLLGAVVMFLVTRNKKPVIDWLKTLADANAEHQAEVAAIQKAHDDQLAADARASAQLQSIQQQVRAEYDRNQLQLDADKEKLVAKLVKQFKDDPHAMADAIQRETNVRVIVL